MTCTCSHTEVNIYSRQDRFDPTRTTSLRAAWVREMNRRFRRLRGLITQAIVEQDCFGMMSTYAAPASRAFAFPRTADKISGFTKWLDTQVKEGILEVRDITQVGQSIDGAWTNKYVYDSYKRGVIRARYELKKGGFGVPGIEQTGGIDASMSTPFHMDRVGALYTRVFTGLKGITDAMDQQISQILGQGLIDGDHPRLLARKLNATISGVGRESLGITDSLGRSISPERRARMLARTEVIRAHHQAVVQEYENWKVEGVNVMAEWVSAGYNVCPECQDLEVGGPYTIEEVRNMIPAHPNCRCTTIPVKVEGTEVGKEKLPTDDYTWKEVGSAKEVREQMQKYGISEFVHLQDTADDLIRANLMGEAIGNQILAKLPKVANKITRMKSKGVMKIKENLNLHMFHEQTFALEGMDDGVLAYYRHSLYGTGGTEKPLIKVSGQVLTRTNETLSIGTGHNVGTDFRTVIRHEYGHHVYFKGLTEGERKTWEVLFSEKSKNWWTMNVSTYGSASASEAFAETFAMYTSPGYRMPYRFDPNRLFKMNDGLEKFMEKLIGKRTDL